MDGDRVIEGEASEVQTKPSADVLRGLADEVDAGKPVGYVLLKLDNETGDVGAALYQIKNVHIAYSLLHDIADKLKASAKDQSAIVLPPGTQRQ